MRFHRMQFHCIKLRYSTEPSETHLLAVRQADERNKDVIFKNCAPFTKCIRKIKDTEIDLPKILI